MFNVFDVKPVHSLSSPLLSQWKGQGCVMTLLIVMMDLMNLPPSVCPHVQLTCLPVRMDPNVFPRSMFAMGLKFVVTDHITLHPDVTTVLLIICSGVVTQV